MEGFTFDFAALLGMAFPMLAILTAIGWAWNAHRKRKEFGEMLMGMGFQKRLAKRINAGLVKDNMNVQHLLNYLRPGSVGIISTFLKLVIPSEFFRVQNGVTIIAYTQGGKKNNGARTFLEVNYRQPLGYRLMIAKNSFRNRFKGTFSGMKEVDVPLQNVDVTVKSDIPDQALAFLSDSRRKVALAALFTHSDEFIVDDEAVRWSRKGIVGDMAELQTIITMAARFADAV